ncbi:MAG: hypothetical protein KO202_00405 [Methanobacteriaceae archaeon]|jgi:hypothetical protein|nr:hypothetical protein [Methanobacteriaceae archaeon]
MIDKEKIKSEVIEITNNILKENNQDYRINQLSIINKKEELSIIGSLKIYDEKAIRSISDDLKRELKKFGKVVLNSRHIAPCCELSYDLIMFDIILDNYS